jgi:Protein of unknown function (DUF5672)
MSNVQWPRLLPQVHLCCIDDVEPALAHRAILETSKQILPASATVRFSNIGSIERVSEIMWYESWLDAAPGATHVLFIQYDGWVLNSDWWDAHWLDYDYVGAAWPWHSYYNVGNGGFSLRSIKLLRFLTEHKADFPLRSGHPEDDLLCRHYRPALEAHGFRWAPEHEARAFAFEREVPRPTFGFHGLWHIPQLLAGPELDTWLAAASPYVRSKPEWRELEAALPQP